MGTELLMEGYRDKHSHLLGLEHWQGIWFSLPNSENYVWHRVGALERLEKIDKSWLEKKKISRTGDDISQRPGNLLYFLEKRGGTISPTLLFHIYSLPLIFFHSSLPPLCSFPLSFLFLFLSSRSASASTEQKLPSFGLLGINQHRETLESIT